MTNLPASPSASTPPAWQRMLTTWAVPVLIGLAYVGLVRTSGVHGWVAVAVLLVLVVVALLWLMFREMTVHAALSRAAAIGEPDQLQAMAQAQADRRWTRTSRMPFQLYVAMSHELRGEWAEALVVLDEVRSVVGLPTRPWGLVAARIEIAARLELGDIEAARTVHAASFASARPSPGSPAELFARESAAKLALAEGDPASALPTFVALGANPRVGPAARSVALLHVARCHDALGDAAAAATARGVAATLTPKLWTARA